MWLPYIFISGTALRKLYILKKPFHRKKINVLPEESQTSCDLLLSGNVELCCCLIWWLESFLLLDTLFCVQAWPLWIPLSLWGFSPLNDELYNKCQILCIHEKIHESQKLSKQNVHLFQLTGVLKSLVFICTYGFFTLCIHT